MPGKTNPADVLSRLPLPDQLQKETRVADQYIHYVTTRAIPKGFTMQQLAESTKTDVTLQQVQGSLVSGKWEDSPQLTPFQRVKSELSTAMA